MLVYAGYFIGMRPFSELARYVSNVGEVGGGVLFSGNLSLAAGVYRLGILASAALRSRRTISRGSP